ncbi:MAG: DUF484 family protein [Alphaproteobacteria bacterium]|nr:DUF484 family protein [Alphaproteobacteria bacterium]MDX5368811.1 DUF484 family protein [Alphaproteobacteria bacterium]MDX5463539.1 DUF484 family protein [Alphaproteobacteria bacterium]
MSAGKDPAGAPAGATVAAGSGALPAPEAVRAFLEAHPGFLARHLDLVVGAAKQAADDAAGPAAVSFQSALIDRLHGQIDWLKAERAELIRTAAQNEAGRDMVDRAVLALIEAQGFDDLLHTLTETVPGLLGIDSIGIVVEGSDPERDRALAARVSVVAAGTLDELIGQSAPGGVRLVAGGEAPGGSQAIVRLALGGDAPPAAMLLWSRDPERFAPGQGTALLKFLGGVMERITRQWLDLPPAR